jgi:hypothetical protein
MTTRIRPERYGATPSRRAAARVAREGITVGLIGAGVAMLLFLLVDVAEGMPLRTPALLGAALFHGARGGRVVVTAPVLLGYSAVHLAGFVLFRIAMASLFALAEREKRVLSLIFMLGCCLAVTFLAMVYVLAQWTRDAITPWVFLAGHLLAAAAAAGVLCRFHAHLLRELATSAE